MLCQQPIASLSSPAATGYLERASRALIGATYPIAVAVLALACTPATPPAHSPGTATLPAESFTLVNLHPDEEHDRLYAVNFQQAGLIPVCSRVRVLERSRSSFRFRVEKTGEDYEYLNHKAAAEPFDAHLSRFFGHECPRAEVAALGEIDRRGVREGRVFVGMTKRGVVLALGPPPRHVTPDLDRSRWTYWRSRFNRFIVNFDEIGRVDSIQE